MDHGDQPLIEAAGAKPFVHIADPLDLGFRHPYRLPGPEAIREGPRSRNRQLICITVGALSMSNFVERRENMVDCQIRPSGITQQGIIGAMLDVPRENFVPSAMRHMAYIGDHLAVGSGRVVLDPRILAKMLEAANLQSSDLVLDIGSCFGYSAAVVARLVEAVIALEEDKEMFEHSGTALARCSADNVAAIHGNLRDGAVEHGKYDVILLEGGFEMLPKGIADQLVEGGRIAGMFAAGSVGRCQIGTRCGGRITWRTAFDASAPVLPGFRRERRFSF